MPVRLQFGLLLRNARINQFETILSTAPKLQIRSGIMPANCAATDTGVLLCEITLPTDWLTTATNGTKTKTGTWAGVGAVSGIASYFRLRQPSLSGNAVQCQGNVTDIPGEGAMEMVSKNIVAGLPVTVTGFVVTDGNA